MGYILRATILRIDETVAITGTFRKRDFVVSDKTEAFPQVIIFEAQQKICEVLNNYRVGSLVDIEFDLRGKANGTKVYNTLVAFRVNSVHVDNGQRKPEPAPANKASANDLPFKLED